MIRWGSAGTHGFQENKKIYEEVWLNTRKEAKKMSWKALERRQPINKNCQIVASLKQRSLSIKFTAVGTIIHSASCCTLRPQMWKQLWRVFVVGRSAVLSESVQQAAADGKHEALMAFSPGPDWFNLAQTWLNACTCIDNIYSCKGETNGFILPTVVKNKTLPDKCTKLFVLIFSQKQDLAGLER